MDICPEQERLLTEKADVWLAYNILEARNRNSPDLKELATEAGAASHQSHLHIDSCPVCRREKDPDVPVADPNL